MNQFSFFAELFQDIPLSPLGHINGKHLVVNQAAAEVSSCIRMRQFNAESLHQLFPYFRWNVVGICGINIMVEHQAPEHHFPVIADEAHQPLPVKLALGSINDVADISAIKTLTARDKDF